jgi:hypothetical protein
MTGGKTPNPDSHIESHLDLFQCHAFGLDCKLPGVKTCGINGLGILTDTR